MCCGASATSCLTITCYIRLNLANRWKNHFLPKEVLEKTGQSRYIPVDSLCPERDRIRRPSPTPPPPPPPLPFLFLILVIFSPCHKFASRRVQSRLKVPRPFADTPQYGIRLIKRREIFPSEGFFDSHTSKRVIHTTEPPACAAHRCTRRGSKQSWFIPSPFLPPPSPFPPSTPPPFPLLLLLTGPAAGNLPGSSLAYMHACMQSLPS